MTWVRFERVRFAAAALLLGVMLGGGCSREKPRAAAPASAQPPGPAPVVDMSGLNLAGLAPDANQVIVTVNSQILTRAEMERETDMLMQRARTEGMPESRMASLQPQFEMQAMDHFIARVLLAEQAEREKVMVSQQEVDEAMARLVGRLQPGVTLDQALAARGITPEHLRTNIEKDLKIQRIVDTRVALVSNVAQSEIEALYTNQIQQFQIPESVKARHILVSCAPTDDDAKRKDKQRQAAGYREQLLKGEDFAAMALAHSDCPSKERGGDLGAFPRGQMVREFDEAAFSQATNVIGPVVETQFGYHIIQVQEHTLARTAPLSEVQEKLAGYLNDRKKEQALMAYIGELKRVATITYGPLARAPAPDAAVPGAPSGE
jgi:peptidyl-prolyl cis-trans isomerase C